MAVATATISSTISFPTVTNDIQLTTRYIPEKVIAKSLYGEVFLAKDTKTNNLVAIKTCQMNLVKQLMCKDDPSREAEVMRVIPSNENCLELIEEFDIGNVKCLVYPYCERGDLFDMIGTVRGTDILIAFAQIVSGLQHLHSHGIAHLDMSCENVLIDKEGTLKISDFGVSEIVSDLKENKIDAVGKTFYMSPELAFPSTQSHDYDPRSADMYSLGVTLFMLTFGFQPYNEPSVEDKAFCLLMSKGVRELLCCYGLQEQCAANSNIVKYLELLLVIEPERATIEDIYEHLWNEIVNVSENDA